MKEIPFKMATHIRKGHKRLFQVLIFGNYKKLSGRNRPVSKTKTLVHIKTPSLPPSLKLSARLP
jgi:hypothetical protein